LERTKFVHTGGNPPRAPQKNRRPRSLEDAHASGRHTGGSRPCQDARACSAVLKVRTARTERTAMDRLDVAAPPSAQRAGCTKQSECIRLLQNEREDRSGAGATEGGRILVTSATTTTNLPVHQLGVAFRRAG